MTDRSLNPIVSICSITYNHEKYIKDAVDGFLMQETNFPFEIVISDDDSTDNTRALLEGYHEQFPDKIRLLFPDKNLGVVPNFAATIAVCKGKYIALCEGDDYWTYPLKLQKQVDFMEAHPDCSICGHKVKYHYEDDPEKNHEFPNLIGNQVFSKEEMYGKYISPTCSIMFRRQKIDKLVRYLDGFKVGDLPLFYFYWQMGNFGYIDQVMATYRITSGSFWYLRDECERIPHLFDTFVKIKSRLRIKGINDVGRSIIYYALELLQVYYPQKDYRKMRGVIKRSFPSLNSANKKQVREFRKYSVIALFPNVYELMKSRNNN